MLGEMAWDGMGSNGMEWIEVGTGTYMVFLVFPNHNYLR